MKPKVALQRRLSRRMLRRSNAAHPIPPLSEKGDPVTLDDLAAQAHVAAEGLRDCARDALRERVSDNGKLSAESWQLEAGN